MSMPQCPACKGFNVYPDPNSAGRDICGTCGHVAAVRDFHAHAQRMAITQRGREILAALIALKDERKRKMMEVVVGTHLDAERRMFFGDEYADMIFATTPDDALHIDYSREYTEFLRTINEPTIPNSEDFISSVFPDLERRYYPPREPGNRHERRKAAKQLRTGHRAAPIRQYKDD